MKQIENNIKGESQFTFAATLLSVASEVRPNKNGVNYLAATIKFVDVNGKEQITTCTIYEKNVLKGMEVGKEYHATAAITPQGPFITLAPFAPGAERATLDMFGEVVVKEAAAIKVGSLTT
jgi:hypothetical protein